MRVMCRHCQARFASCPKGLCWSCYYTPEIHAMHPSTSKFANRGVGNGYADRPASAPCPYPPRSPEKIAVMAERAARMEALFHEGDGQLTTVEGAA